MDKKKLQKIINACDNYSDNFTEIETIVMEYGPKNSKQGKIVKELVSLEHNPENPYPKGWFLLQATTYLMSRIFTRPTVIGKFLKKYSGRLTHEAIDMLHYWQEVPYIWSVFTIIEEQAENLFLVMDMLTLDELLIYSPGLKDMQRRPESRKKAYLSILFHNTQCWQSTGIIHYYSLSSDDFEFFCKGIDEKIYDTAGLAGVIDNNFIDFFELDSLSNLPKIMHGNESVAYHWKPFIFKDIVQIKIPGDWEIDRNEQFLRFRLAELSEQDKEQIRTKSNFSELLPEEKSDGYWKFTGLLKPELYIDSNTEEGVVLAASAHDYFLTILILSSVYPIVHKIFLAEQIVSFSLFTITEKIEGFYTPWEYYTLPFKNYDTDSGDRDDSLKSINILLKEVTDAKNHGKTVDIDKRCRDLEINREEFQSILDSTEDLVSKKFPELILSVSDKQNSLSGFPIPTPAVRKKFSYPLTDEGVFLIYDSVKEYHLFLSLAGGIRSESIGAGDLVIHIEDLFLDTFDHLGFDIMNYFFYMLTHLGDVWHSVRSYGVEILKLYHQVIFPNLETDSAGFIELFSQFVFRKLCTNAICEVQKRPSREDREKGTFSVKRTPFFDNFFELVDDLNK